MDCSNSNPERFPSAKTPMDLPERKIFREEFREIPRTIGGKMLKESFFKKARTRFLNIPFNLHTAKIYEKTPNESVQRQKKQRLRANQVSGD
jgi:hypothetical protein